MSKKRSTAADQSVAVAEPVGTVSTSYLDDQRAAAKATLLASEEIFLKCAERNEALRAPGAGYRLPLDPADVAIVAQAGYETDRHSLMKEIGRCANALRLMAEAGTRVERESSRWAADKAAAAEASRRPELEEIIRVAKAELETLSAATRRANEPAERMEAAMAALSDPKLLPPWARPGIGSTADEQFWTKRLP